MPAQMQLIRDDDRQIRFANPWKWGPVISLVGLLIWYLAPLKSMTGFAYWLVVGAVAFTVIVGVLAFLSRDELLLDLTARVYTRRRGYWPGVKKQTGSFRDFRGLLLSMELRSNPRGGQYPTWVITLQSAGAQVDVTLVEFRNEGQAYRKVEAWSKKLGLPAFDNTGGREQPLQGKTIALQPPAELQRASIPSRPPGSRLLFLGTAPTRTIVLPRLGLSLGVLILALFPAITLWMGIAGYDEALHHVPPRSTGFAVGVICFGILMVLGLCFSMFGRTTVQEQGERILVGTRAFGWNYNVKTFAKRDIEDVEIKATPLSSGAPVFTLSGMRILRSRRPSPRAELFMHSRDQVVRIGQELSPQDLEWLRLALLSLAAT